MDEKIRERALRYHEDLDAFRSFVRSLEEELTYHFCSKELLREALTHDSYWGNVIVSDREGDYVSNKILAFIGDSILHAEAAKYLYERGARDPHVVHTFVEACVEEKRLYEVAKRLRLNQYILHVVSGGFRSGEDSYIEDIVVCFKAIVGAWSLDLHGTGSMYVFLQENLFSHVEIQGDARKYGLSSEEIQRIKLAYGTTWTDTLTRSLYPFLGETFRLTPEVKITGKRIDENGLPVFRAIMFLGTIPILEEEGRTAGTARRYVVHRCALKLLDGADWVTEILQS